MSNTVSFKGQCEIIRSRIKEVAGEVLTMKKALPVLPTTENAGKDDAEIIANVTLAYRHLEDASMRLGKAIQAYDGGVSVYDKDKVVGA